MNERTMHAAVLYGKEDLRLERTGVPEAGGGEIVVRVAAALTCGTDLKVYRRGYHARMLQPPIPFGHELAGIVAEIGTGVTNFRVGDRVVPDAVPFEHAALTEPLACVVRGLEESGAKAGDSMIVIGAGPIGLMFLHAAALAGIEVCAVVKREDQVDAAMSFGARQVLRLHPGDTAEQVVAAARAMTPEGRGADIVIEAVATPPTWEWAVGMVRKGGVVNFFGGPPSGTVVALDTNRLHYGDITLKASFHHTPATCRAAFDLIAGGRFNAAQFITAHAPLSDVPAVFRGMMTRTSSGTRDIKTAILPWSTL